MIQSGGLTPRRNVHPRAWPLWTTMDRSTPPGDVRHQAGSRARTPSLFTVRSLQWGQETKTSVETGVWRFSSERPHMGVQLAFEVLWQESRSSPRDVVPGPCQPGRRRGRAEPGYRLRRRRADVEGIMDGRDVLLAIVGRTYPGRGRGSGLCLTRSKAGSAGATVCWSTGCVTSKRRRLQPNPHRQHAGCGEKERCDRAEPKDGSRLGQARHAPVRGQAFSVSKPFETDRRTWETHEGGRSWPSSSPGPMLPAPRRRPASPRVWPGGAGRMEDVVLDRDGFGHDGRPAPRAATAA